MTTHPTKPAPPRVDAYSARAEHPDLDPRRFIVSVLVMRADGKPMTARDLAVAEAAFPRPAAPTRKATAKRAAAATGRTRARNRTVSR